MKRGGAHPVKLAISQIAWNAAEEPRIAELMAAHGLTGVEVVPGRMPAERS